MEHAFQKKPLGRRWHLMSKPIRVREFSVLVVLHGAKARLRWNIPCSRGNCETMFLCETKQIFYIIVEK